MDPSAVFRGTWDDPLHLPLHPVLSSIALVDNETGRDGEESCMSREMPSMGPMPKKMVRQRGDVVVRIPARRPEQNRDKRRDLIRRRLPRNGCKIDSGTRSAKRADFTRCTQRQCLVKGPTPWQIEHGFACRYRQVLANADNQDSDAEMMV